MRLLSRSKSKRLQAAQIQDTSLHHISQDERVVSTSYRTSQHNPNRSDVQIRPHTAGALTANNTAPSRLSFFEAFKIEASDDIFQFPKPQSARSVPPEIRAMASRVSSAEPSPMIGVALGSPSHPPQGWHGHKSYERSPRRLEVMQTAYNEQREEVVMSLQTPRKRKWTRFGGLFRKPTTRSKPVTEQQHEDRPRMPQRARTEPPKQSTQPETQPPRTSIDTSTYAQSRARSTAKMQSILGIDTLQELEQPTLTLASPPPAGSRPFRRRDLPLPNPPSESMHERHDSATIKISDSGKAPRLELALPSYQLERYSVMFENLLDPKPSIYERRNSRLQMFEKAGEKQQSTLSPIAQTPAELSFPDRRASSPLLAPVPAFIARSPAAPEPLPKDTPLARSPAFDHSISLEHRPSPLQTDFPETYDRDGAVSRLTFFDSPSSDEDTSRDFSPQTPESGSPEYPRIRVFSDAASHRTTTTTAEHKDTTIRSTTVWHSVLPAPPHSSTSSRFSVDVHKALDSPSLPTRSRSFHHGQSEASTRPSGRPAQVAMARSVSVKRAIQQDAIRTGSMQTLRPKVINVSAQAHSRKSSVLDTVDPTSFGMAL